MSLFTINCTSIKHKELSIKDTEGFRVSYFDYKTKPEKSINRTVIIFPPTGGVTYLEKSYAKNLCKKGANVKVLNGWSGQNRKTLDLTLHQDLHSKAMKAFSMVLDTIGEKQTISVMGTSLGGLYSSVAANKFDRINNIVVVAAGTPIPEVIAHSEHESMKTLRNKRYKQSPYNSRDEYAKAISDVFFLDPQDLPPKYKDKKLAMVILKDDLAVPTKYQQNLKNYWLPEKTIYLDSNHIWGIIKTWLFHSDELVDFLIK